MHSFYDMLYISLNIPHMQKLLRALLLTAFLATFLLAPASVFAAKRIKKTKRTHASVNHQTAIRRKHSKKITQAQLWYWRKHPKISGKQKTTRDHYEANEEARERAIVSKILNARSVSS